MTVLQEMETERLQKRERLRLETRRGLHAALGELVAGRKVIVFGSLVKRGRFTENGVRIRLVWRLTSSVKVWPTCVA